MTKKYKPQRYWQNKKNVLLEARNAITQLGVKNLPSPKSLWSKGYSSLSRAIIKYHGGFAKFREVLGEDNIRVVHGSWSDYDYTRKKALEVIEELGVEELPSHNKLVKLGYSSLAHAISNYHKGFNNFRRKLGEKKPKLPDGTWKSLEYAVSKAQGIMLKEGWDSLPSSRVLNEAGYSSLANSIKRYHGGIPSFRKLLDEKIDRSTNDKELFSLLENYVGGKDD